MRRALVAALLSSSLLLCATDDRGLRAVMAEVPGAATPSAPPSATATPSASPAVRGRNARRRDRRAPASPLPPTPQSEAPTPPASSPRLERGPLDVPPPEALPAAPPPPASSQSPGPIATPLPAAKPVLPGTPEALVPTGSPVATRRPATPPARSGSTSPVPAIDRDRAESLVGGTWHCESMAGLVYDHVYGRLVDGGILLQTRVAGKSTDAIRETYRYDRGNTRWSVVISNGLFVGRAGRWVGEKWAFDDTRSSTTSVEAKALRLIYTDLGDVAFRRDFQQFVRGSWQPILAETCKRSAR